MHPHGPLIARNGSVSFQQEYEESTITILGCGFEMCSDSIHLIPDLHAESREKGEEAQFHSCLGGGDEEGCIIWWTQCWVESSMPKRL